MIHPNALFAVKVTRRSHIGHRDRVIGGQGCSKTKLRARKLTGKCGLGFAWLSNGHEYPKRRNTRADFIARLARETAFTRSPWDYIKVELITPELAYGFHAKLTAIILFRTKFHFVGRANVPHPEFTCIIRNWSRGEKKETETAVEPRFQLSPY